MVSANQSNHWHRVEDLKLRLRPHVDLRAHQYRGQRWYVLQDPSTGHSLRISSSAYALVGRLDGERTLDEAHRETVAAHGDAAPTQDEAIRLIGTLHRADVLQTDVPTDVAEVFTRSLRTARGGLRQMLSPFLIRIPLVDPDERLRRWGFVARPFLTRGSAIVVSALLALTATAGLTNVTALAADARAFAGDPRSWIALFASYVLLKALHELGHAFAARGFGAPVHEMGITLLFFVPVPYVDASGASALADKRQRIAVAIAGVAIEGLAAGVALLGWSLVEPGFVRAFFAQAFFLGTASTLLFNGNPLLRYDAYYVLADAIEMPNLFERSRSHIQGLAERHLLGLEDSRRSVQAEGEAPWLLGYGLLSIAYRFVLVLSIGWMMVEFIPRLGAVIGFGWIALQIGSPTAKGALFLLKNPRLEGRRRRVLTVTGGAALTLVAAASFVPIADRSLAEGVVWLPERFQLRAGTAGFVREWLVAPGSFVKKGQPVMRLDEPLADARVRALRARIEILQRTRHGAVLDRMQLVQTEQEIAMAREELRVARERLGEVVLRSPSDGLLLSSDMDDLPGRFVRQGDVLGFVVDESEPTVRVALDQQQIARVRAGTRGVFLRLGSPRAPTRPGRIVREVPAASHRLPSAVLGTWGGGSWVVDGADADGLETLEPVFWVDVQLDRTSRPRIGDRVYVRFDHERTPLLAQMMVGLHRLLLSRVDL